MSIEYKPFELHTHSCNSDGVFTVGQLCENAKSYQYDGIALTDHNTTAGWSSLPSEPAAKEITVIRGIEWTTFFGHMLVLEADEYVDWRFATPDTIDSFTERIQAVGGTIGIAHPFGIGSPICTGCRWEFTVANWANIDYIEVWSKPFAPSLHENELSFKMWTQLLNAGHHIAASSGRDWHRPDEKRCHTTATYLGIDGELTAKSAVSALKTGRSYVTSGPALNIRFEAGGRRYQLGDTAPAGAAVAEITVDESARRDIWQGFNIASRYISLVQNGREIARQSADAATFEFVAEKGWLRFELYGDYLKSSNALLAFSSPIYID